MFSFRELVESMEEKTFESVSPILHSTRPPLSGISADVHKNCKNSTRSQTSQHRAEPNNEKAEGSGRRKGYWEYSESEENLEQREGVCWEEVVQPSRMNGQSASNKKLDTESSQAMQKEINVPLIFTRKHRSLALKHQNFSLDDLYDAFQTNHCTLLQKTSPLLDAAYQEPALDKQDLNTSNTSLRFEHQPTCSAESSKCERKHSFDLDLLTRASRSLSEDKNAQAGRCRYLKTNRRTIRRMDTKCKTKERVCQSVNQKHPLNLSHEEISEREEVSNVGLTEVRELSGSGDNSEYYIPHNSHSHANRGTQSSIQYVEVCRQEAPVKETVISTKHPESHKTAANGSWSRDLSSFMTDCLHNTDAAAVPLLVNNLYSDNHRNALCYNLQTKDGHEWTSHSFRDQEEVQTFRGSRYASKDGEKASDRIRGASYSELGCSESPSLAPTSSWTPKNNVKKITTQEALSLWVNMNNFRNKKHFKELGAESVKGLKNDKVHKIKRYRSSETQGRVAIVSNENASIGDNEEPRSSSPSSLRLRCQLCSSWWRNEASLARHQRQHTPTRPFACTDCPSRFNQLVHLQIHRRTHTGEKPFRCGTCNASFSRKDRLRSHERRHSGEQPYTCPYCPAAFRDASSLRGHVPAHAHQPPFTCRLCSATFAHLSTFTSHWRLHN